MLFIEKFIILFELIKYIISIDITQEIKKILSESSSFLKKPLDKINNIKNEKKDIMINKLIFFFQLIYLTLQSFN